MKFACPQKGHAIRFESAWDYLNHLQKCHIINDRIKECGETRKYKLNIYEVNIISVLLVYKFLN